MTPTAERTGVVRGSALGEDGRLVGPPPEVRDDLTVVPRLGVMVEAGEHRFHVIEEGAGPDTVFLHGGGPGCTGWTDFGPPLPFLSADRRCLLVDLLQYGFSDKPHITGPVWDHHAGALLDLFDALGLDDADVVCNSWGGTAAIRFASLYPERVRNLVITGSMPVFHGPLAPLPEGAARGRRARDDYYGGDGPSRQKMYDLIARLEWFDTDAIPDETVTIRYEQSLDPGERRLGETGLGRGDMQDLSGDVSTLQVPVLFVWGMYDDFLTPDYPLMLARMAPQGQLYVMDRASHHLQEERPREYAGVVGGWLDRLRDDDGYGSPTDGRGEATGAGVVRPSTATAGQAGGAVVLGGAGAR